MSIIADLHIHSRHSLATSKQMEPLELNRWAKIKGIHLLGTGDFTHPDYLKYLEKILAPTVSGLFQLKNDSSSVHFMLTGEVNSIFRQDGKMRKIHTLLFAPDFQAVGKINKVLCKLGKTASDGRPVFTFPVRELAEIVFNASEDCMVIPAHAWTPWFSIFGAKSGFDSIEEAFGKFSHHIHAIETGLSSDPAMNRRVSALDNISLISNSDAHSPSKLGREANVFDCPMEYSAITDALKTNDSSRFLKTIEFFPEEGKYHFDGHRKCGVCLSPAESRNLNDTCPVCGKFLTLGVMHRVDDLADRSKDFNNADCIPFVKMVPLQEIISKVFRTGPNSKRVWNEYHRLIEAGGNEFGILLDLPCAELATFISEPILKAIMRVRKGNLNIRPGYDGVYGKIEFY